MSLGQISLSEFQSRLVLAFLCLFPWLYWPGTHEIYGLRESIFFGLTGLLVITAALSRYHLELNAHPVDLFVVLGFCIRVSSWVVFSLNTNFEQPLIGLHSLIFELSTLLFYFQIRRLNLNNYFNNIFARYFLGSCLLICIISLLLPPITANAVQGRFQALFFHPNFLGIFGVVTLALAPKLELRWKLSGIILVLLSGSRIALGLLIALVAIRGNLKSVLSITFMGFLLLGLRATYDPVESFRLTGTESFEMRNHIYQGALKTILNNPLGTGPGVFGPKVHENLSMEFHQLFPDPQKHSIYKAHNTFLEWTAESGWLMGILLLITISFLLKMPSSSAKLSLGLLIVGSLFSVIINYPSGLIMLSYLLAVTVTKNNKQSKSNTLNSIGIKTNPGAIIVRFISPCLVGVAIIYYASVNFQAHLAMPKIINDLNKGAVYPAWSKLTQRFVNPPLHLENLYYQFRISLLAGEESSLVSFFEKHLPAWVDVSYQLSLLFLERQQPVKALQCVERSIDYHPLWPANYYLKASILKQLELTKQAETALEKAKKLSLYDANFRTPD